MHTCSTSELSTVPSSTEHIRCVQTPGGPHCFSPDLQMREYRSRGGVLSQRGSRPRPSREVDGVQSPPPSTRVGQNVGRFAARATFAVVRCARGAECAHTRARPSTPRFLLPHHSPSSALGSALEEDQLIIGLPGADPALVFRVDGGILVALFPPPNEQTHVVLGQVV
jgi:hypothetical protein